MDDTFEPVTGPQTEPPDHRGRDIDVRRGREVVGTHEPISLCEDFAQARGSELLPARSRNLSAMTFRRTRDGSPGNDVLRYTVLLDVEVLSHYLRLVMVLVGPHGAHGRPLLIVSILTPKFQQLLDEFRLLEPCIVPNMQYFCNLVQFPGRLFQQLLFSEVYNPLPSFAKCHSIASKRPIESLNEPNTATRV